MRLGSIEGRIAGQPQHLRSHHRRHRNHRRRWQKLVGMSKTIRAIGICSLAGLVLFIYLLDRHTGEFPDSMASLAALFIFWLSLVGAVALCSYSLLVTPGLDWKQRRSHLITLALTVPSLVFAGCVLVYAIAWGLLWWAAHVPHR